MNIVKISSVAILYLLTGLFDWTKSVGNAFSVGRSSNELENYALPAYADSELVSQQAADDYIPYAVNELQVPVALTLTNDELVERLFDNYVTDPLCRSEPYAGPNVIARRKRNVIVNSEEDNSPNVGQFRIDADEQNDE